MSAPLAIFFKQSEPLAVCSFMFPVQTWQRSPSYYLGLGLLLYLGFMVIIYWFIIIYLFRVIIIYSHQDSEWAYFPEISKLFL